MTRVRVIPPMQVVLNGTVFGPGETVDAPDDVAKHWTDCGYVEAVAPPRKTPRKAAT